MYDNILYSNYQAFSLLFEKRRDHTNLDQVDAVHTASEKGGKENRKSGIFSGGTKKCQRGQGPGEEEDSRTGNGVGKLPDIQSGSGLDAEETEKRKQDTCENCSCVAQMVGFGNIRGHPGGDPIPKHSLENNGEHDT